MKVVATVTPRHWGGECNSCQRDVDGPMWGVQIGLVPPSEASPYMLLCADCLALLRDALRCPDLRDGVEIVREVD